MTGAEALDAALEPRPFFRGPLANQRPRIVRTFGSDPWLVLAVAALVSLGMVMVFNVSYFPGGDDFGDPLHFFRKHLVSIAIGLVLCVTTMRVGSNRYRALAYPLLAVAIVAMLVVLIPGIGSVRSGARRWLSVGPLTFQPSELAKFALVLYLARSLVRRGERVREFWYGIIPHCLMVAVLAGLCLLEPDFGTVALSGIILVLMLFAAGARVWHLGLFAAAAVPGLAAIAIMEPYRLRRLTSFLDCRQDALGDGFQLCQALIAFGSGGLWGVGLGQGQQKMYYLPAAHTDFIFSVIGEELGLVGAAVVLALFALVAFRGLRIAARHPDDFGSLLAFGLTALIVVQGLLNFGVALGTLPTKGLTLPFVSYGGSAMMISLAEVGVLLGLARESG
jgi:cell division protein FtsW